MESVPVQVELFCIPPLPLLITHFYTPFLLFFGCCEVLFESSVSPMEYSADVWVFMLPLAGYLIADGCHALCEPNYPCARTVVTDTVTMITPPRGQVSRTLWHAEFKTGSPFPGLEQHLQSTTTPGYYWGIPKVKVARAGGIFAAANYETAACHLHTTLYVVLVMDASEVVENWSDFEESDVSSEQWRLWRDWREWQWEWRELWQGRGHFL